MKKNVIFLALATIGLASCNGGFKNGPGGMQYKIINDKAGPSLKTGDFMSINLTLKNDGDSVLGSTYDMGHPVMQMMQKSQVKGDIFSGLEMLSEGDSAIIKLNIDSLSKGHPGTPAAMKGKHQIYIVKIEKVIAKGNLSDEVFQGRLQEYVKTQADQSKNEEAGKIKKYIADNKLKVTQTTSGLQYLVTKEGTGPKPAIGDTVEVNYVGRLLGGKVFDTSIKSEAEKAKMRMDPMRQFKPLKFPVGVKSGIIQGWDEGLQLLNKGSKATFIIPSNLAYGEQGNGPISPFTPLAFDVELINIIHPNPNAPKPVVPTVPQVQAQGPGKR